MVKAKIPQLHDKYLRVVVLEAYAEDSFGATVCHAKGGCGHLGW